MSVCVAAFSEAQRAIVCIADRALSYGGSIQWDSDSSKMLTLSPKGPLILFAGDETPTTKVLAGILSRTPDLGEGKTKAEVVTVCEAEYKEAMDELIEAQFLRPRLLTKQDYVTAITAPQMNPYIRTLAEDVKAFQLECQFLVCGFASNGLPYILSLDNPGIITDMTQTGFHAIGSGWEKAIARLLFSEFKRSYPLYRTAYDSFDAKAFSEMAVGVGFDWELRVITKDRIVELKEDAKELIEKVWTKFTRSPFEKRKKDDPLPPPRDWMKMLETYFRLIMENPDLSSGPLPELHPRVGLTIRGDLNTEPNLTSRRQRKQMRELIKETDAEVEKLKTKQKKAIPPSIAEK